MTSHTQTHRRFLRKRFNKWGGKKRKEEKEMGRSYREWLYLERKNVHTLAKRFHVVQRLCCSYRSDLFVHGSDLNFHCALMVSTWGDLDEI